MRIISRLVRAALPVCALAGAGAGAQATAKAPSKPAVETLAKTTAPPAFSVPKLPVERYTLPNGLTVLLSPDHAAPVAAVDIWYHVGSKNELPGRTGFAHLFEHVMFNGSEHIPYGVHFKTIEGAGGNLNGSTWNDRTNYFEAVPSNEMETALWLESDRMGFLLPALDQAKLDAQREVVKNERRQRVDNVPYGSEDEVIGAAMYPASHPYSWPVIGSMADLSAASLEDVKNFFRKYYAPTNATLVVTGDFEPAATKALIAKYFGPIPAGPAITRPSVPKITLNVEKRLVLEDARAKLPQMTIAWPTVGDVDSDNAPLTALARVLTQDRTSRLTKLLVYDRQLATRVAASQNGDDSENAGRFEINVTPRPNASLTEIEKLIDSTLAGLSTSPPGASEVDRFKNTTRVSSVTDLDGALNKAEILAKGQTFFGDPLHYIVKTNELLGVTPGDVARVTKQYLTPGRIVVSMVPAGKLDLVSKPTLAYTNVTPKTEAAAKPSTAPPPAPASARVPTAVKAER
ncbi:MAG: M16 family metallopeptidase [Gemmatimonadaceae bacterium]